jgi:hypothetical protein
MSPKERAWIEYLDAKNRLEEQIHHGSPTQIADAERKLDTRAEAYAAAAVAEARAPLVEVINEAKRIFGNALVLAQIGRPWPVPDEELPEGIRAFFAKADAVLATKETP